MFLDSDRESTRPNSGVRDQWVRPGSKGGRTEWHHIYVEGGSFGLAFSSRPPPGRLPHPACLCPVSPCRDESRTDSTGHLEHLGYRGACREAPDTWWDNWGQVTVWCLQGGKTLDGIYLTDLMRQADMPSLSRHGKLIPTAISLRLFPINTRRLLRREDFFFRVLQDILSTGFLNKLSPDRS